MEDYQSLSSFRKVKKILPKVILILLLSVILPTADVGTDLALINQMYEGRTVCVDRDKNEYLKCDDQGPRQYCYKEKISNNTICGVSQYNCTYIKDNNKDNNKEFLKCHEKVGPDRYCTSENKTKGVCVLKKSSDTPYFCRYYKIWSPDVKDLEQCGIDGAEKYCSNSASNTNLCSRLISHPKTASALLFFFLLNYVMGLVTCLRLEGRKWLPLIAALFNLYPQFCK